MKLASLESFFANSPAARLLRSPHAAQVVFFLHSQFKERGTAVVPHSMLAERLAAFQESLHATLPEVLIDRPDAYLANWSSGESRWLRRFHDADHAEPVYELTPHTEEVLKFLTDVLERNLGFVGTESRLKRIIDALSDIVVRSSDDPTRRIEHLREQRDRIDREIQAIESGEAVETYGPTAIRERFADAVADLVSLQGDFRAVEESFKRITRDVQQRQAETTGTRGEILGFALEAEDRLKTEDQGVSFDEFVRLILSPRKQEELETIVKRLHEIEVLAEQVEGMHRVRGMIDSLREEAEKVLRTTRRLSATLRRLLDTQSNATRLRLTEVLGEIKAAAARLAERPPTKLGIDIAAQIELVNAAERPFWTAPTEFDSPELSDHEPDEDDRLAAFRYLAELHRLDWPGMQRNIDRLFVDGASRVTLPELLEVHPPASGAIEVLGYLQLAHDGGHEVDPSETELVELGTGEDDSYLYEVPKVTFLHQRLRLVDADALAGGPLS